ncbi:hypothetical protein [Synechococcus sp. A15-44]|uniref:hypothetical protein n=1 Tax=Synechococcus sp. A15-44 TaxID=1050646 RepID=UPI0016462D1E|nr:hypothetical protein [Synechococcus sp. A15-44]
MAEAAKPRKVLGADHTEISRNTLPKAKLNSLDPSLNTADKQRQLTYLSSD